MLLRNFAIFWQLNITILTITVFSTKHISITEDLVYFWQKSSIFEKTRQKSEKKYFVRKNLVHFFD